MMLRLLDGVRVVEWAEGVSAPFAARILADLGAEVIKIEPQSGDPMRRAGPFPKDAPITEASALFAYLNAGKRSLVLEDPNGRDAARFQDVLRDAALLVLSHPLASEPPDSTAIVSITPFGRNAPALPCSDLTLQHRTGWAHAMARPVTDPETTPPRGGADHEGPLAVGVAGAMAALWGLLLSQAVGTAPRIDLASYDIYAAFNMEPLVQWSAGERAFSRERIRREGTEAAGGLTWILPCAQGWVMVSPREQHQWEKWIELLGNPSWATDDVLCGTRAARREHFFDLQPLMADWSRRFPPGAVAEQAQAAGVACFPVSSPGELLMNAQLLHRGFFDRLGILKLPGLPFQFTAADGPALLRQREIRAPDLNGTW